MEYNNARDDDHLDEGEVQVESMSLGKKIWDSWDIPDGRVIRPSKRRNIMRYERMHKTAMILDPYEYAVMDKRDTALSRKVLEKELEERTIEATVRRQKNLRKISTTAHRETEKVLKTKQTREARKAASEFQAMEDKLKAKVHHTMNVIEASGIGIGQNDAAYVHTIHKNGAIESYALTKPRISRKTKGGENNDKHDEASESEKVPEEVDIELRPSYVSAPSFSFMYIKYRTSVDPESKTKVFSKLTPVKQRPSKKELEQYLDDRYSSYKIHLGNVSKRIRIDLTMHFLLCASNRRRIQLIRLGIANKANNRFKWAQLIHRGYINDIRGTAGYMVHKSWKGHYRKIEEEITQIERLKTRLRLRDISQNMRLNYFERMMKLETMKRYVRRSTALKCRAIYDKMYLKLSECMDDTKLNEIQSNSENLVLLYHHYARNLIARMDMEMLRLKKIYKEKQTFSRAVKSINIE